ncbi:MAG TPA: hypothetical protein VFW09_17845 [Solirubrobacteraceae bacterium]|nr:hypothetical protein [Solirubrobacteraceae bacterium]
MIERMDGGVNDETSMTVKQAKQLKKQHAREFRALPRAERDYKAADLQYREDVARIRRAALDTRDRLEADRKGLTVEQLRMAREIGRQTAKHQARGSSWFFVWWR